jgi:putative Holliday junction resolvase
MRCLGIDYGTRRWGLAFGDDLGVATPLPALVEKELAQRWAALGAIVRSRGITDLVVGYPLNMDGTAGFKAAETDGFAGRLRAEFSLPVHFVDERLTSYEAGELSPKKKRRALRSSGVVDSRAATLILQDYLGRVRPLP